MSNVTNLVKLIMHICQIEIRDFEDFGQLQAAKSISSWTRIVPDIIRPIPNPGKMYALFAWKRSGWQKVYSMNYHKFFSFSALKLHFRKANLSWHKNLPVIFYRGKGAPTCKDCSALCIGQMQLVMADKICLPYLSQPKSKILLLPDSKCTLLLLCIQIVK